MGMCKPSGGISSVVAKRLNKTGTPNTRMDRYDEDGNLVQQRWYGPDGKAIWDRDWSHGGNEEEWPHDHQWDWSKNPPRQKAVPKNDKYC